MRLICHLTICAIGLTGLPASGQEPASVPASAGLAPHTPKVRPALEIRRAAGPIVIDGRLDDAGWVGAARASGFTEFNPREGAQPAVDTEAWVTYDAGHLYVAIIARDDPASIRSSLTDRDRMFSDDYIGVMLDTYGDASWAYLLFANPRGIQGDSRMAEGRGEDDRFDIIFHSRGQVTDEGYVVEMAIPFASLRFPVRSDQRWGINFWRNRPRSHREQISWAAISRNDSCTLCQLGTLTGMHDIRPGGSLEIIPAVVASQAGALADPDDPGSEFVNGKVTGDVGVTARYAFASGITAEATVNPDFSQVESDAGQIDVNTTFALSFPERRTFFQEGSDLFSTWFSAVYTRSINNPLAAAKLIGRMGRTTVAYLGAWDEDSPLLLPFEERSATGLTGGSLSNVLRVRRTIGRNSHVGTILTDRRLEGGGSGSVAGVDAMLGFGGVYGIEFQLLGSHTREPDDPALLPSLEGVTFDRGRYTASPDGERFSGYAQYTSFERNARTWSFDFDYWASSPTFRADNGFETRNDFRRVSMSQGLTFYPTGPVVQRASANLFLQRSWNFAGERKGQLGEVRLSTSLAGQTYAQVTLRTMDERFRGVDFNGLQRINLYVESLFSQPFSAGAFLGIGDGIARNLVTPIEGRARDIEVWARFRPTSWATINPSLVHARLREPDGAELFSGYILRTRAEVQFTRELFLRTVVQYNDFASELSVEPLLTYRANPFTLVYIGSTRGYRDLDTDSQWTRTRVQYFAKVQYLFRR